jgi:hypothetical protein
MKSLVLASLLTLTTSSSFSQLPTLAKLYLVSAPKFRCGPHVDTYVVKALDNRKGYGIRCVKFGKGKPGADIPKLVWYGEGTWNGATYRHIGQVIYKGSNLVGFASDIYGNGENTNKNFPGNLKVQILTNQSTIRVTGAWNEEWKLVKDTNYQPLSRPRTCGEHFDEYKVYDLTGSRKGEGLRCVLRADIENTTWFGNGNWEGSTYSHIGTRADNRYGASDICDIPFGPICNIFAYGSLKLTPVSGGFDVTGAWREKWRK